MLIVSDANIFIDMDCAGLTTRMFRLPEEFAVPDVLFMEELSGQHAELPGFGLRVLPLREEVIADAVRLGKYRQLSQNDIFALALARQEGSPLLTGDQRLRKAAEVDGVDVRGNTFGVLNEVGLTGRRDVVLIDASRDNKISASNVR